MCLVDSFINYKKVSGKGIRPNTISKYSNELNRLLTYFRDKKQIGDEVELVKSINQLDMDNFKNWMIENEFSISTINGQITTCKQFSNYLLARNIIQDDFSKGLKQVNKNNRSGVFKPVKVTNAVTKEDFNNMLKTALTKIPNKRCFEFNSIRNVFLLMVMGVSGFRIDSDFLTLKLSDITEENGIIYFNRKAEDTKTGELDKRIPIVGECRRYYDKYIKLRNNLPEIIDKDYLILSSKGKRFHANNSNNFIKEYCDRIGIGNKYSNHSLRHTFSTVGNILGISHSVIDDLGGWKPNTMQGYYSNGITDEARIEAVQKIENYLIDRRILKGVNF